MAFNKPATWSPVELRYLQKHQHSPVNQLCGDLAKSRYAVKKKLAELNSEELEVPKKKRKIISKIGRRPDCDNLFLRSSWESNVYRLLKRDESIKLIEYEPTDFTFWQFGHHKGTVSYTPDFKITYYDGSYLWIEVKGFMKPADKTKIRRLRKYYPEEFQRLVAVTPGPGSKTAAFFIEQGVKIRWFYPELNKKYRNEIPNWE